MEASQEPEIAQDAETEKAQTQDPVHPRAYTGRGYSTENGPQIRRTSESEIEDVGCIFNRLRCQMHDMWAHVPGTMKPDKESWNLPDW